MELQYKTALVQLQKFPSYSGTKPLLRAIMKSSSAFRTSYCSLAAAVVYLYAFENIPADHKEIHSVGRTFPAHNPLSFSPYILVFLI